LFSAYSQELIYIAMAAMCREEAISDDVGTAAILTKAVTLSWIYKKLKFIYPEC
jgi:hypothetical protein